MKRFFLLLCCLLLTGCATEFTRIDPEAYRPDPTGTELPLPTSTAAPTEPAKPSEDVSPSPPSTPAPHLAERYNWPAEATFSRTEGKLTIAGTAKVLVPDVSALPVYRFAFTDFTPEQAERLFAAALDGEPTYAFPDTAPDYITAYSRAERVAMMAAIQEQIDKDTDVTHNRIRLARLENSLDLTEPVIERETTAPAFRSESVLVPTEAGALTGTRETTGALTTLPFRYGKTAVLQNSIHWDAGFSAAVYHAVPIRPDAFASFRYTKNGALCDRMTATGSTLSAVLTADDPLPDACTLQTTPAEAIAVAETFLQKAGMADFSVRELILYRHRTGTLQWYEAMCVRTIDGLPVHAGSNYARSALLFNVSEQGAAAPYLMKEAVGLQIDDTGVRAASWVHPLTVTGLQMQDAEPIPFDDVVQIAQEALRSDYRQTTVRRTATVNSLSLALMCVPGASWGEGTLVPVWIVSYTLTRDADPVQYRTDAALVIQALTGEVFGREAHGGFVPRASDAE